jgi:HD-GYP domain-containing protein (c-di-GMP phosphodiesterase class II)
MGKRRRIIPAELEVGSVMPWDAYDERGRLLLRKGLVIDRNSQIEALIERGLFIEADPKAEPQTHTPAPFEHTAVSTILEVRQRLELLCAPGVQTEQFTEQVLVMCRLIAQACRLNQDAALAMMLLERNGRYSIRHSVDAAIACHVVGTSFGFNGAQLTSTVAAALTMNATTLQMQDMLQGQKAPLTDEQREIIQRHPTSSAAWLRGAGVTDELWIQAVLCHHEAIDGTGYPQGRRGEDIPLEAQIVSLADVYCARVSGRNYRKGLRPNAALRALFLDQGKKVSEGLIARFIKAVGVFPPGTPVKLENGELAVVVQRGENAGKPQVCSIIGPRGMPLAVPIRRDTGRPTYGVREVVEWQDVGAMPTMHALWGKAAAVQ